MTTAALALTVSAQDLERSLRDDLLRRYPLGVPDRLVSEWAEKATTAQRERLPNYYHLLCHQGSGEVQWW